MSTKQATLVHVDEDYIDMELTSPSNFFSYTIDFQPKNNTREFEFQMSSSISNEKDSKTTPADDLFYKGKLLPLHLPPRIQMVQKILENTNLENSSSNFPFTPPTLANYTPLESCNISSSESCRVSSEVNQDEYSFEMNGFVVSDLPKIKSWPKKLKIMNQLLFGQKLKASKAYLKSLFNKSSCTEKSYASDIPNHKVEIGMKNKGNLCDENKKQIEDDFVNHRKSFSGVIQRQYCVNKASSLSTSSSGSSSNSSSFSFSSAGYYDLQLFKRSISANYELEGSIEGAIAHCKQSQQQCSSKNGAHDARICSEFGAKVGVCGDKESETATLSSHIV
ncbi:putative membrane-associated kinase regulator [Trifolium repens]|nr:putative membrane-associated kinase regulator [Trifolium repens]